MNRAFALLLAAFALLLPGSGALAQNYASGARIVSTTSWVEEWDPATRQWVRVADETPVVASAGVPASEVTRSGNTVITQTVIEEPVRFIAARPRPDLQSSGIARFGPFRVIDGAHAALVGATDARSPADFAAMMAAYPGLQEIEFLDAPGTTHDIANLKLGRAIRAAGLATYIPAGGSARSGAVELFLAGTRRKVDPDAVFAVHSWRDELGREPADFADDAPENRLYLDYYADMGMTAGQARAFYAMTNSVPHAGAKWMQGAEMAQWIPADPREGAARSIDTPLDPRLAEGLRLAFAGWVQSLRVPAPVFRLSPLFGETGAPTLAPELAPKLAYADIGTAIGAGAGAGLLDSGSAFP